MRTGFARLAAMAAHPRARHLLVACGFVVGLALASATVLLLAASRRVAIADAGAKLENLSLVLAEETDREFQAVQQIAFSLADHLREEGIDSPEKFDRDLTSSPVNQDLLRRIAAIPQLGALVLISRRGETVNVSHAWPAAPVDVRDRDFFRVLTGEHPPASFISAPRLNRLSGAWTLLYAFALTAPDGKLLGIVGASLRLASFEEFFARISMQDGSTVALYRTDGVLLARYPHLDPGSR
ncbi:MAG TPA: hypothetical protein VGL95_04275, partial [Acetobacteraceae bacterium]